MPTNKNASYRYRVIDNCLKNTGRKWTLQDLIDTVSEKINEDFGITKGVSKRTIQGDISIMKSIPPRGYDAPIVCENGCYYYDDPDFSINNSPLNEKDISALEEAIAIFRQFATIPVFEDLQSMIMKLEGKMLSNNDHKRKIIDFEKIENVKGTNFIKQLYENIKNKHVIDVKYRPFTSNKSLEMTIHPYLIKEYNNRWFLIAYNEEIGKMSHLALDRIVSFNTTGASFIISKEFDEKIYFDNIVGITLPENAKPDLTELHFSSARAPYIKTKPLHKSQKILKEDETGLNISLNMVINKELITLLLGFGKDLKVIKPLSLQTEIREILSDTIKKYK
jgi:predicted DNA-binding transcriptional regulator YafY